MKITLSPEVEEYLRNKHKEVIEVFVERTYYTHMMESVAHTEIKYGAPKQAVVDQFTLFEVDGFKVYIANELLDEKQDIFFHLDKFLGIKYVEVDGVKIHH